MKVCSTYYDNVPDLERGKYTLVRVSCAEPPAWFMESYDHVDLSGTFGPTPQMLVECHPTKDWETGGIAGRLNPRLSTVSKESRR